MAGPQDFAWEKRTDRTMARYGVISDIHGNLEALLAALELLESKGIERIVCLGDIVGYNADPDRCAALLRDCDALAIAGDHDLIAIGRKSLERCSNTARYSLARTRRRLKREAGAYLETLPAKGLLSERVLAVHGGVRDPAQALGGTRQLRENAAYLRADYPRVRLCLYGHTLERRLYEVDGETVRELPLEQPFDLQGERIYFANPGSVDASRKREHKLAECAVFDSAAGRFEFHRLEYDTEAAERKAKAAGYRIGRWTDAIYSIRRRLSAKAPPRPTVADL
jgi:predicted phosphodiesterase